MAHSHFLQASFWHMNAFCSFLRLLFIHALPLSTAPSSGTEFRKAPCATSNPCLLFGQRGAVPAPAPCRTHAIALPHTNTSGCEAAAAWDLGSPAEQEGRLQNAVWGRYGLSAYILLANFLAYVYSLYSSNRQINFTQPFAGYFFFAEYPTSITITPTVESDVLAKSTC